jgi:hypothetical protein
MYINFPSALWSFGLYVRAVMTYINITHMLLTREGYAMKRLHSGHSNRYWRSNPFTRFTTFTSPSLISAEF